MVAAGPTNTIFATVQEVSRDLLLLIATTVVGLVAVGAAITRDINNSLDRMTTYATEIEDGNLDVDIEQSRIDEFSGLAVAFVRIRPQRPTDGTRRASRRAKRAREEAEQAQRQAQQAKEERRKPKPSAAISKPQPSSTARRFRRLPTATSPDCSTPTVKARR